jgi:hypothetical protein
MAGYPKRRADIQRLESDPELGELVFQMLEEGKQFARICTETKLTKGAMLEWLERPEQAERYARARGVAATSLADEAIEIADEVDASQPGELMKARIRIGARQWHAERWNRNLYGQKQAELTVNLNVLHLDALRHRNSQPTMVEDFTPKPVLIENKQEQEP